MSLMHAREGHADLHTHTHTNTYMQALHTHSTGPLASHAHDSLQQWTDRRHRQLITQTPSRGGDAHAPYCTIRHRRRVAHNPHPAGYKAAKKRRLAIHIDRLLYTLPTTMHSQPQRSKLQPHRGNQAKAGHTYLAAVMPTILPSGSLRLDTHNSRKGTKDNAKSHAIHIPRLACIRY